MTRRPRWLGELLVVGCLLVVYDYVAGLARVRPANAVAHGRALLALSPGGVERAANRWFSGLSWLQNPSAYYYDFAHINVTIVLFVACFVWRPAQYRRARSALVLINVLALAVFLAYPAAPPRLLPGAGFVDVVARSGTWGAWEGNAAAVQHANTFGSMPSLHMAWAVWVALTVMSVSARRRWHALAWVHVSLTAIIVIVTGNHYLVDVVAGAGAAGAAWVVTGALYRRRPHVPNPTHRRELCTVPD